MPFTDSDESIPGLPPRGSRGGQLDVEASLGVLEDSSCEGAPPLRHGSTDGSAGSGDRGSNHSHGGGNCDGNSSDDSFSDKGSVPPLDRNCDTSDDDTLPPLIRHNSNSRPASRLAKPWAGQAVGTGDGAHHADNTRQSP